MDGTASALDTTSAPPPKLRRTAHRKTRTGCFTCKRRRIKCDERKPVCKNCHIHESAASCVYPSSEPLSPVASTSPSPSYSSSSDACMYALHHMRLLHHFTTSTALTLSGTDAIRKLWQVEAPLIGMSFPFVLHAILAIASIHLAHERPDERRQHWAKGIELQQQGVAGAQQAMKEFTPQNCTAVYLFSALTCMLSLARGCGDPGGTDGTTSPPGGFMEWVVLYRGVRFFLSPPYDEILHSGPLRPMFELGLQRRLRLLGPVSMPLAPETAAGSGSDAEAESQRREAGNQKSRSVLHFQAVIHDRVADTNRLEAHDSAIDHLQRAFRAVYDRPAEDLENMDVFAWMFSVSDEYVALLKQRDPIALALFACFAGLIREMHRMWWTHGWGEWCIRHVCSDLEDWLVELVQH